MIHTAFDHDFSRFVENSQKDRRAIDALGLRAGRLRPAYRDHLQHRHGLGPAGRAGDGGRLHSRPPEPARGLRAGGARLSERGVNVLVVRLSQIHDTRKQGLVSDVIELARRTGVSAYVGEGRNAWSATHVSDTARLFRLALERARRAHATAEAAIPFRDIARAVGESLERPVKFLTPDEAAAHFTWLTAFVGKDMSASSASTQERLGWRPTGPGLLADIAAMAPEAA